MDKEQFKIFLSEVLKESGKLELEVTEYGDVYIALKMVIIYILLFADK